MKESKGQIYIVISILRWDKETAFVGVGWKKARYPNLFYAKASEARRRSEIARQVRLAQQQYCETVRILGSHIDFVLNLDIYEGN